LAVVFHPEYWADSDPVSMRILRAFGCAVHEYASRSTRPDLREAVHV
jgi:gamma-glutamyl-gamma-aminobutyrate hydrolase PuuD